MRVAIVFAIILLSLAITRGLNDVARAIYAVNDWRCFIENDITRDFSPCNYPLEVRLKCENLKDKIKR